MILYVVHIMFIFVRLFSYKQKTISDYQINIDIKLNIDETYNVEWHTMKWDIQLSKTRLGYGEIICNIWVCGNTVSITVDKYSLRA